MQQQGEQLLAGAAFAADQHRSRRGRDPLHIAQQLFRGRIFCDPRGQHRVAHAAADIQRWRGVGDYVLCVRGRAALLDGTFDRELLGRLAVAFLLLVFANSDGWNRFADFQSRSRL